MKLNDRMLRHMLGDPSSGTHGLSIPEYQRPYAWGPALARDFLEDIRSEASLPSSDPDDGPHIGTVILHHTGNDLHIVDGQQRLTTLMISMAVIERQLAALTKDDIDTDLAEEIGENWSVVREVLYRAGKWRRVNIQGTPILLPSDVDNTAFGALFDHGQTLGNTSPRHKITAVALAFDDDIRRAMARQAPPERFAQLIELARLIGSVKVMVGVTSSFERAILHFEKVNSRGVPLSADELIKHKLFEVAPATQRGDLSARWNRLRERAAILGDDGLRDLLYMSWLAHHDNADTTEEVTERDKAAKRRIHLEYITHLKSGHNPLTLLSTLERDLDRLALMGDGLTTPDEWRRRGLETLNTADLLQTRECLRHMYATKYRQAMPLILAAWANRPHDLPALAQLADSIQTRRSTIAGLRNNVVERVYSSAALNLRNGVSTERITAIIRDRVTDTPSDDQLRELIVQRGMKDAGKTLLWRLHTARTLWGDNPETLPISANIHLEHVAPQAATPYWAEVFGGEERLKSYCYRLGNQVLLGSRKNQKIGQKPFHDKKSEYRNSLVGRLTTSVADHDTWGPEQINRRSLELAELIIKVWPF